MRLLKNRRGFTLIEIIVVVIIIGILVTYVTLNTVSSTQDAKQTSTMRDILVIAQACQAYVAENDTAPAAGVQEGPLTSGNPFVKAITKKQLVSCPIDDKWGHPLEVYSGKSVAKFPGFSAETASDSDFLIISRGREGRPDNFVFNPEEPDAGMYKVQAKEDYNKNIVNYNGTWIHAPRSGGSSSGK
jgi:general secretion pathway protein G